MKAGRRWIGPCGPWRALRRSSDLREAGQGQGLRRGGLRLGTPGREPQRQPPVVRLARLRKPGEGAPPPRPQAVLRCVTVLCAVPRGPRGRHYHPREGSHSHCTPTGATHGGRPSHSLFRKGMNDEVRPPSVTGRTYLSADLWDGVQGRRITVSCVIRAYRKLEDGTCPTSPGSSSVSWKPTVARTAASGAASSSSGPRGRHHPLLRHQPAQGQDRKPGHGQARGDRQGDGLPPALWFEEELTGADRRGAAGTRERLAGRVERLFDAIKDPKTGEITPTPRSPA